MNLSGRVPDLQVPSILFTGTSPGLTPVTIRSDRKLDARAIRRSLPSSPTPERPLLADIVDDESGSMWSGNDSSMLRLEAALIGLEHLAGRTRRLSPWYARVTTFDQDSPLELPITRLNREGLAAAETALLARSPGGSSNLGPALTTVEASNFDGDRLLVVMSDFELYDADPRAVLANLIASKASAVLALVFRSTPPVQLLNTRVRVVHIDPTSTPPAEIARSIVDAAVSVTRQRDVGGNVIRMQPDGRADRGAAAS